MEIVELKKCSEAEFEALAGLMRELSPEIELRREALDAMLADAGSHLFVGRTDGRIVACASLCVYHQPFETDGSIEAVVVSSSCRGLGLGRELMEFVIAEAGRLGVQQLHLTSRPSRVAANAMYQSLGFARKETNCYMLDERGRPTGIPFCRNRRRRIISVG